VDAEQHLEFATRQVVVIRRHEKETDSEFDAKIERWKSGESIDGIDAKYEGGEVSFVGVVGVTCIWSTVRTGQKSGSDSEG